MTIAQAEGVAGLTWCRFRFMLQFLDGPLALNLLLISVMTLSLELVSMLQRGWPWRPEALCRHLSTGLSFGTCCAPDKPSDTLIWLGPCYNSAVLGCLLASCDGMLWLRCSGLLTWIVEVGNLSGLHCCEFPNSLRQTCAFEPSKSHAWFVHTNPTSHCFTQKYFGALKVCAPFSPSVPAPVLYSWFWKYLVKEVSIPFLFLQSRVGMSPIVKL